MQKQLAVRLADIFRVQKMCVTLMSDCQFLEPSRGGGSMCVPPTGYNAFASHAGQSSARKLR